MNPRQQLASAAVAGILLGALSACGGDRTSDPKVPAVDNPSANPTAASPEAAHDGGHKMSCSAAMMDGGKMSCGGHK